MGEAGNHRAGRSVLVVAVLALLAGVAIVLWPGGGGPGATTQAAAAQSDPCAYEEIDVSTYGGEELRNPPEWTAEDGVMQRRLKVAFTKRSKTEIAGCPVKLRSYNRKLVGPTFRVRPGDDLRPLLVNDLPAQSKAQVRRDRRQETKSAYVATTPHPFNATNLHFHGLHVSPRGHGDNVLIAIDPQTKWQYDVEIPGDHPPGTFWYHAHGHGSTAIQVGSGMAGAIVIEDDPDEIPPALAAANAREKVMIFQTILYDAKGKVQNIKAFFPSSPPNACENLKPTCTWTDSKRLTTINGQIVPEIHMQPGEVQRWRMVGGAFREGLNLQLEGHELNEIALDGLYLGTVDEWPAYDPDASPSPENPVRAVELQPGYRSDVLVQAGEEGRYKLYDVIDLEGLRGTQEPPQHVATLVVEGDPIDMELPTDEEMSTLAPFPGVDLEKEAVGVQVATFKIGQDAIASDRNYFNINFEAFDPKHTRRLALGSVDEWSLSTIGDPSNVPGSQAPPSPPPGPIPSLPHVFHIHVNPFQMTREGPDGEDEVVWKDTVLIPPSASPDKPLAIYTKYTDFTGKFVIHCHILDHEDLGMMQAVKVVEPGAVVDKPPDQHH